MTRISYIQKQIRRCTVISIIGMLTFYYLSAYERVFGVETIKNLSYSYTGNTITLSWQAFPSNYTLRIVPKHLASNTLGVMSFAHTDQGMTSFQVGQAGLYKIEIDILDQSNHIIAQAPSLNVRLLSVERSDEIPMPTVDPVVPPIIKNSSEQTLSQDPPGVPPKDNDTMLDLVTNPLPDPDPKKLALLNHLSPNYEIYDDLETYQYQTLYIDIPIGVDAELFLEELRQKYGDITIFQPFLELGILTYKISFTNTQQKNSELLSFLDPYIVTQGGTREWPLVYKIVQDKGTLLQQLQTTYLQDIGLLEVMQKCPRPEGKIKVAVIDNAFDTSHEDFGNNVIYSYDVADDDDIVTPPKQDEARIHGTVSASIIGAEAYNNRGIIGTALDSADLMLIKASSDKVSGEQITHGLEALQQAIKKGAKIINISRGAPIHSALLGKIITKAQEKGIVIIAAAGNYNQVTPFYPAAYEKVISIASVNKALEKSSFSNYGSWVTLAAPGENIRALGFNQRIAMYNGTSEAAPLVAGIISFLMAHGYNAEDIDHFLIPYNSFFQIGKGFLRLSNICTTQDFTSKKITFQTQSIEAGSSWDYFLLTGLFLLILFLCYKLFRYIQNHIHDETREKEDAKFEDIR